MKHQKLIREIKNSREKYDSVEIPEELDETVRAALKKAEEAEAHTAERGKRGGARWGSVQWGGAQMTVAAAAAAVICFTAGLNTSQAFASAMGDIPVLGAVSRVLTFRDYEKADEDKTIHMEVPQIQDGQNEAARQLTADVNAKIEKIMSQYEADAEKRIAEYKKAFLATGGTEEEFQKKHIRVNAGYEVAYEAEDTLSLIVTADENWSGAGKIRYYYNIDLAEGKIITLKDLLGENYVEKANESIRAQMKERMEHDKNLVYWDKNSGIEGFTTVDDGSAFYINENGNPVIVFEKYEIAPGAFGRQEFEIK